MPASLALLQLAHASCWLPAASNCNTTPSHSALGSAGAYVGFGAGLGAGPGVALAVEFVSKPDELTADSGNRSVTALQTRFRVWLILPRLPLGLRPQSKQTCQQTLQHVTVTAGGLVNTGKLQPGKQQQQQTWARTAPAMQLSRC